MNKKVIITISIVVIAVLIGRFFAFKQNSNKSTAKTPTANKKEVS